MFIQTHDDDFIAMSKIETLGVRNNSIYATGPNDIDDGIRVVTLGYFEDGLDAEFVLNHMIQFMAKYGMRGLYIVPENSNDCGLI